MGNPIKSEDLFEKGSIESLQKELQKAFDIIVDLTDAVKNGLRKEISLIDPLNFGNINDIKKLEVSLKSINTQVALGIKFDKEKQIAEVKIQKAAQIKIKSVEQQRLAEIKLQQQREKAFSDYEKKIANQTKLDDKAEKQRIKNNREYNKTQIQLTRLNGVLKDLQVKQAKGIELTQKETAFIAKYTKVQQNLDGILKKVDKTLGIHNRNVGRYTDSIKDAIEESGYFSGALGKLTGIFNLVSKAQEQATTKAQKFGLVLKGAGILGIITLLKGLSDTFTKTAEGADKMELATARAGTALDVIARTVSDDFMKGVNEKFIQLQLVFAQLTGDTKGVKEAFEELKKIQLEALIPTVGFTEKLRLADEAQIELTKATQAYRIELRKLNLAQQAFALAENTSVEISNDATRSLDQRNKALEDSFVFQRKRLGVEAEIANKSLEFTNKQIAIELKKAGVTEGLNQTELSDINNNANLKGKISNELLDEQNKNLLEQRKIADAINSLGVQHNQRRREQLEKELALDIALLRSKKNSTKLLSEELQKQIDNEALQIDLREKLANDQLKLERDITDAIIKRIKEVAEAEAKSTGVAIPIIEKENLLLEGNAILLEEKIKKLGLSEGLTLELAGAIKKAQDAETKGLENLNKLSEEKIKLEQRLTEILIENKKSQADKTANQAQEESDRIVTLQEETQNVILEDNNAFNQLMISQRKTLGEENIKLIDIEADERKKSLVIQSKLDIDAIENSTKQFEEKEAEKQRIAKESVDAIAKIDKDASEKKTAQDIKDLAFLKQTRDKQIQIIAEDTSVLLDAVGTASQQASEKKQAALDKEIDDRQNNIERQEALAEKGQTNQLAFEKKALAEKELQRQQQAETERKRQELIAFLRLLSGYAEDKPDQALGLALRDMALAKGAQALFLADGAEAIQGAGTERSDSIPAMLSKNESVINAKATIGERGLATAWNEGNLHEFIKENYLPQYLMEAGINSKSTAYNMGNSAMLNQLVGVNKRLQSLEKAIVNKKETSVILDNLGNVIVSEVERGIKTNILFKKRKARI